MDKYTELLKDIATIIADAHREKFLLSCELEKVKAQLSRAEEQLEDAVALNALMMAKAEEAEQHA